jgi:hypothetical protein
MVSVDVQSNLMEPKKKVRKQKQRLPANKDYVSEQETATKIKKFNVVKLQSN